MFFAAEPVCVWPDPVLPAHVRMPGKNPSVIPRAYPWGPVMRAHVKLFAAILTLAPLLPGPASSQQLPGLKPFASPSVTLRMPVALAPAAKLTRVRSLASEMSSLVGVSASSITVSYKQPSSAGGAMIADAYFDGHGGFMIMTAEQYAGAQFDVTPGKAYIIDLYIGAGQSTVRIKTQRDLGGPLVKSDGQLPVIDGHVLALIPASEGNQARAIVQGSDQGLIYVYKAELTPLG